MKLYHLLFFVSYIVKKDGLYAYDDKKGQWEKVPV